MSTLQINDLQYMNQEFDPDSILDQTKIFYFHIQIDQVTAGKKKYGFYDLERVFFYDKSSVVPVYEIFKEITKQLDGKLIINGYEEDLDFHASAQESIYRIFVPHEGETIIVEYAMGAQHVAETSCTIETLSSIPEFEITTRSPFATLFRGKNNRVKIKCERPRFRKFLKQNEFLEGLNQLSENTGFEPYTYGENKKLTYTIRTEYHLRFPERTQELENLINFHRSIIDEVTLTYR